MVPAPLKANRSQGRDAKPMDLLRELHEMQLKEDSQAAGATYTHLLQLTKANRAKAWDAKLRALFSARWRMAAGPLRLRRIQGINHV